jgi:hypothetical protein
MAHSNLGPPVAGAYIALPVYFNDLGAGASEAKVIKLPAGMKAVLVGVTQDASAATSATVEVGSTADPNGYCTSQALAATASELSLDGVLVDAASGRALTAAAGELAVTATTAGGGSLADGVVTLWLYVTAHPTNSPGRLSTRDVFRNPLQGY